MIIYCLSNSLEYVSSLIKPEDSLKQKSAQGALTQTDELKLWPCDIYRDGPQERSTYCVAIRRVPVMSCVPYLQITHTNSSVTSCAASLFLARMYVFSVMLLTILM